jgi:hypothetical protein
MGEGCPCLLRCTAVIRKEIRDASATSGHRCFSYGGGVTCPIFIRFVVTIEPVSLYSDLSKSSLCCKTSLFSSHIEGTLRENKHRLCSTDFRVLYAEELQQTVFHRFQCAVCRRATTDCVPQISMCCMQKSYDRLCSTDFHVLYVEELRQTVFHRFQCAVC